jgi:hypothetical protein
LSIKCINLVRMVYLLVQEAGKLYGAEGHTYFDCSFQ